MSFTLCTSYAIIRNAGVNSNSDLQASGAYMEQISEEAEGFVCMSTRYDWITNYTALENWIKYNLADAASCIAATKLVAHDMGGYTSRGEAESLINILYDRAGRILGMLKTFKKPEEVL